MTNPYEPIATSLTTERRSLSYGLIFLAGLAGYGAPIAALGLMTMLTHGWSIAWENLERVARIHREMSLNAIAAFLPNVACAFFFTVAASKWSRSDDARRRWCMLGSFTLVGYVVVFFSNSRWHLIPWAWPSEISNLLRSILTLVFPSAGFVAAAFSKRQTGLCARFVEQCSNDN